MGSQKDNSNQLSQQPSKMGFTSFLCLASLLFVGAAFGCDCSGTITEDGNTGANLGGAHGECLTKWGGRYWCYVNPNSPCPDKQLWSEGALKLYYSYEACNRDRVVVEI